MYESIILQKSTALFKIVSQYYRHSNIHRVSQKMAVLGNCLLSGSAICRFVSRDERISGIWENSICFKIIQGFFDFITKIIGNVVRWIFKHSERSLCYSLHQTVTNPLSSIGHAITAVIGLVIGFIAINLGIGIFTQTISMSVSVLQFVLLIVLAAALQVDPKAWNEMFNASSVVTFIRWLFDVEPE